MEGIYGLVIGYGATTPYYVAAYEGETLIITCNSTTKPQWKKDGVTLQGILFSNSLVLVNVKEKDSGWYICHGSTDTLQPFIAIVRLLVGGMQQVDLIIINIS